MEVSHTVSFRTLLVLFLFLVSVGAATSAAASTVVPLCPAGTPFDSSKYPQNWPQSAPMTFQCNWDGTGQVYISGNPNTLTGVYADDGFTITIEPSGQSFDAAEHWAHQHPVLDLTSGMRPGVNTITIVVRNWVGLSMSYGWDNPAAGTPFFQNPYIVKAGSVESLVARVPVVKPDPPLMRASYDISLPIENLKSTGTPDLVYLGCTEHVDTPRMGETRYMPPPGGETPITKSISPGGTQTFSFRYLHGWDWLMYMDDSWWGLKDVGMRMTASAINIATQGYGGSILTFFNMLLNSGNVQLESTYTYTFTSPNVIGNLKPLTVTVQVPFQKRQAAFNSWNSMSVSSGLTTLAPFTGVLGLAPCALGEVYLAATAQDLMKSATDPDINYQHVVERKEIPSPEADAIQGPMKGLATGSLNILEDTNAMTDSLERYYGAQIADDEEWQLIHLNSAARYAQMAATDYGQFQVALETLTSDMKARGITLTDADIDARKDQISSEGLPDIEVTILRRLGYTDQEIEQLKEITVTYAYNDLLKTYDTSYPALVEFLEESHQGQAEMFSAEVGAQSMAATVEIKPEKLVRDGKRKWIKGYIEIPRSDLENIDLATVKLNGVPAETNPKYGFVRNQVIEDRDGDGTPELMVKFDKAKVAQTVLEGTNIVTVTGKISGSFFLGDDTITVKTCGRQSKGHDPACQETFDKDDSGDEGG